MLPWVSSACSTLHPNNQSSTLECIVPLLVCSCDVSLRSRRKNHVSFLSKVKIINTVNDTSSCSSLNFLQNPTCDNLFGSKTEVTTHF